MRSRPLKNGKTDFDSLVGRIQATSEALQQDALVVINRSVTARAWLTGYYIVEYEQHVDAAQHGERQDDLLVIPFFKGVHEHVVGDVPNETKKLSVLLIVHFWEKKSERIGEPFTLAGTRMISREKLPRQPSVQT